MVRCQMRRRELGSRRLQQRGWQSSGGGSGPLKARAEFVDFRGAMRVKLTQLWRQVRAR